MVRVAVSVEGLTEERFVNELLAPHFLTQNLFITPVDIHGKISVSRVQRELCRLAYSFDKVTTLYDFYGFKDKTSNDERKSLERRIKDGLSLEIIDKVYPYIQMYEFEGLLFSSPEAIASHVSSLDNTDVLSWAQSVLYKFQSCPERINDSPTTAPSKRLEKQTNYKKTIDGPNIAKEIGLETLRNKCPEFNNWIELIESWR